jgi:hypothetical protein
MPDTDEAAISDLLAHYNVVTDALDIDGWAASSVSGIGLLP